MILLIFLCVVFAGLLAFRVAPELIGREAEASESPPSVEPPVPKLTVPWGPPTSAIEASFEARKSRRPDPARIEEVADGSQND
jgi:hypothetical protein